ncbi:hypothetical protein FHT93_003736 [Rhizobium sp. BK379]|nr:hypothetical protein [Rhizobium sp. BK379]
MLDLIDPGGEVSVRGNIGATPEEEGQLPSLRAIFQIRHVPEALTSEPGYNRALNSPRGPTRHFGSIALSRVFHATICNHTINSLAQNVLADRIAVGYCVMKFDTSTEFDQVILIFKDPGRQLIVRTVQEAANALLKDWPSDDGEEFLSAVKACVDVMTGKASSWELRSAILRAANEAGVAAVAVLH